MAAESDAAAFRSGTSSSHPPIHKPSVPKSPVTKSFIAKSSLTLENEDSWKIPQFEERDFSREELEYKRPGKQPGLLLIFNQENFKSSSKREGSRRDVNEISITFQRLGFNVDPKNILTDGTTNEILDKLKQVSESDLSDYNSLIVFFLTHGEEMDILETRDNILWANDIWKTFSRCRTLRDKPKMFIIQACKGNDFSTTGRTRTKSCSSTNITSDKTWKTNFLPPDCLVAYSTIEGNVSYRIPQTGSWFIQELCKNFLAYGRRDDVFSLLIRTTKCVSGNYFVGKGTEYGKQMPLLVSTMTKKFYLNTNKDRGLLIDAVVMMNRIYEELKQIKNRLPLPVQND